MIFLCPTKKQQKKREGKDQNGITRKDIVMFVNIFTSKVDGLQLVGFMFKVTWVHGCLKLNGSLCCG